MLIASVHSDRLSGDSDKDADAVLFAISKREKNWLQCAPGFGVRVAKQTCRESMATLKLSRHVTRSLRLCVGKQKRFFQGGTGVLALENEKEAYPCFI